VMWNKIRDIDHQVGETKHNDTNRLVAALRLATGGGARSCCVWEFTSHDYPVQGLK
jgi:hypothetical protein